MSYVKTKHPGVYVRHVKACASHDGRRCNCTPTYRGEAWEPSLGRTVKQKPTTTAIDEAIGWVADYKRGIATKPEPKPLEVGMSVDEFMSSFFDAMESGNARTMGGARYASKTIAMYRRDYRRRFQAVAGPKPIASMDAPAWQRLVEMMRSTGACDNKGEPTGEPLSEHTISCAVSVIKAAYRWGSSPARKLVPANVTRDIELTAAPKIKRRRVAAPEEVPVLLAAIPDVAVRSIYALMFYAGLRISEAIALDWPNVNFRAANPIVHVPTSKTDTGRDREIPMVPQLAAILREHWLAIGRPDLGPLAPARRSRLSTIRINAETVRTRAYTAWRAAGLEVYTPHEGRHTFASTVVANPACSLADLQAWLGHANLAQTARYVQTLPGARQTTAGDRLAASFA